MPIQRDLGLSNTELGYAFGAFTIAYGLFEVPTGRWGDRFGSRGVLARIVLWWSFFTAMTGAATGLTMLVVVRFLFGAGEAGAYPNVARIIARWFPRGERGTAQGLVITSAQIGGALAPVTAAYMIAEIGWRATFVIFSLLGVVWAVAFTWWFRDDPAEHPRHERGRAGFDRHGRHRGARGPMSIRPFPGAPILASRNIWLLGTVQTCSSFFSYMLMQWYPAYLEKGRGVDPLGAGRLASLVLVGAAVGCLASGYINDLLARWTRDNPARFRIYGFCGTILATVCLLAAIQCESATATSIWAAVAFMFAISQQATFWAVTTEIGGRHLGVVFGLLNSLGVPGAIRLDRVPRPLRRLDGRSRLRGSRAVGPGVLCLRRRAGYRRLCWLAVDARHKIPDSDAG